MKICGKLIMPVIIVFILFSNSLAYALDKINEPATQKKNPKQIDAQIKDYKNKYKYENKIQSYDLTSADNFLGKWSLILPDGDNHGDLIIKKMGDTFYA
ncbi:MAG TPA: hypothetical protein PKK26_07155, partial [Candidatus Wallbacteria bacterium]|nr:hypothetical protein [Candidatus Wallbacteria bacterium]